MRGRFEYEGGKKFTRVFFGGVGKRAEPIPGVPSPGYTTSVWVSYRPADNFARQRLSPELPGCYFLPMAGSTLIGEVLELKQELSLLRSIVGPEVGARPVRLRVHVERTRGDRKPYLLIFKFRAEKRLRMSATRSAILLSLLLDLEQRSGGLPGTLSIRELALEVYKTIAPEPSDAALLDEKLRVGFYRFGTFWEEELADIFPAEFDQTLERLVPASPGTHCGVDIGSSDPVIDDALPKLGRPPMLNRLRRDEYLFIPAGGSGGEGFLSEIYTLPGALEVAGAFVRPALFTVPEHVVKKHASTEEALLRHSLARRRLAEGSLVLNEVVPEDCIENLTYFPGMSTEERVEHLKALEHLVLVDVGYSLFLTRSEIPFDLGTYKAGPVQLAMFLRVVEAKEQTAYSCFAVWGSEIAMMSEVILARLREHPSTTSAPEDVANVIRKAYRALGG